jgi:diamine N-acetyltransferase
MVKPLLQPIQSTRLSLRPLVREDLATTLAWRNKERVRKKFFTSRPLTMEEHQLWFTQYLDRSDDMVFLIVDAKLNRPVGQAALYNINPARKEAEFGRLMIGEEDALRRGFAREAAQALISHAFETLRLTRVYLEARVENVSAISLYEKLGFTVIEETQDRLRMEISLPSRKDRLAQARETYQSYLKLPDTRPAWLRELDTDATSVYYRYFYDLARALQPAVTFEIGTCEAKSAAHLAAGNPAGLVITLDIRASAKQFADRLALPNLVSILCNSLEAPQQLRYVPMIDVLFIDGDHRFEQSFREYALYRPFVKEGGLIFFDDIEISDEMRRLWDAIPDPKEALPKLHYTGFGVASKASNIDLPTWAQVSAR